MKVSIIMPAYNVEKYIEETISSVLLQCFTDWELIIIDDGSVDQTSTICQEYLSDHRIKYIKQANQGVSMSRNRGIKEAKGEYIAFLDADDIWEPNNLTEKLMFLENNKEFDWVYSNMLQMQSGSNVKEKAPEGRDDDIVKNILLWEGEVVPGPCSNIVVHRKFIEKGIRFDPAFSTAADQDFCLQLAAHMKGKLINDYLWTYRIIGNSMSRNIQVMERDHIGVYEKAVKLGLFNSFWFRKKCFSNLYLILAGSWWVNGANKFRGGGFIIMALFTYPPSILKIIKKIN